MGIIERFAHFELAQSADGQSLEFSRLPDELTFLAFDTRLKRLVELHVLNKGAVLSPEQQESAARRLQAARQVRRRSFVRLIEYGEEQEAMYYSSKLYDGEALEKYILRRGALSPAVAFSLILQLLEDMVGLEQEVPELLEFLSLSHIYVTLQEDTFLQLLVLDYGFSRFAEPGLLQAGEGETSAPSSGLVKSLCELIFLMLTGQVHAGEDCDRYKVISGLPAGLRSLLRSHLSQSAAATVSLTKAYDDVREAFMAQTRDLIGRNTRKHLVATDALLPESSLRDALLHTVSLGQLVKGRFVFEGDGQEPHPRYPFTLQASDSRTEAPLTVHLLPPRRIVATEHYDAVPPQMWRYQEDKHPNILNSRSIWESLDLTFLTEDRTPGYPLSRLVAERSFLNPVEALIVLRQVRSGIEQSTECGVERIDLHPSNIFLRITGPTPHAREMEKLLQKRLDVWPKFLVMLRPHMTMRSLYEPLLLESGPYLQNQAEDERGAHLAFRHQSFVMLAAYLLSGEPQSVERFSMPDSISEPLAAYIKEGLLRSGESGRAPSTQEFLQGLEGLIAIPELETAGERSFVLPQRQAMASAARPVAMAAPTEHVGSVSDFDEDNVSNSYAVGQITPSQRVGGYGEYAPNVAGASQPDKGFNLKSKGRVPILLVATIVAVLAIVIAKLFGGRTATGAESHRSEVSLNHEAEELRELSAQPVHTFASALVSQGSSSARTLEPSLKGDESPSSQVEAPNVDVTSAPVSRESLTETSPVVQSPQSAHQPSVTSDSPTITPGSAPAPQADPLPAPEPPPLILAKEVPAPPISSVSSASQVSDFPVPDRPDQAPSKEAAKDTPTQIVKEEIRRAHIPSPKEVDSLRRQSYQSPPARAKAMRKSLSGGVVRTF